MLCTWWHQSDAASEFWRQAEECLIGLTEGLLTSFIASLGQMNLS
jgi:hypothetical protein